MLGFFTFEAAPAQSDTPRVQRLGEWHQVAARAMRTAPPVSRPRRTLSIAQQDALRALVALGAHLTADFTPDELRSAFRQLARQYHPDRHPGTSEAEKQRLALIFTRLHDAYTDLQIIPVAA